MARDGSGTYNLPAVAIVPAHSLTNSSNFNATITDIAAALTQSISKDGQTVPTANLPMGAARHINVGAAQSGTEYARFDQIQNAQASWCGTAGGTATVLTITPSPPISQYIAGQRFNFGVATNSTDSVVLSVSGLGAYPIIFPRWLAGTIVEVIYGGAGYFYQVSSCGLRDIPVGSIVIFRQSAAPVGWTQLTDVNDSMLRMVSGTGGSTGGSWAIAGLSNENLAHTHTFSATSSQGTSNTYNAASGAATVSAQIHTHTVTGTTSGEQSVHTHFGDGTWRPAFLDVISCSKNAADA